MENPFIEGEIVEAVSQGYSSALAPLPPTTQLDLVTRPTLDVQALFLSARRNAATRRAYVTDFKAFFGPRATAADIADFLSWPPPRVSQALEEHKAKMLDAGASESSVNRRMSAIRSLLKYAFKMGHAKTDGRGLVDSERVRAYRNTTGIEVETVKKLLKMPKQLYGRTPQLAARNKVHITRDTAILRLLAENGLRRVEVARLDVKDFSLANNRLMILGKGRGTQKEPITLSSRGARDIAEYLLEGGHQGEDGPLFRNLDHRPEKSGQRLDGRSIWYIVGIYGRAMGLDLHPHLLRHAAITNLLNANGGNIAAAKDFSRHADPKTLMIYYHNSQDTQGQMTNMLSNLYSDDD